MEESLKNEILNDIKNINSFDVSTILSKRKERLKTLVKFAKENSEYFKYLYKDIDFKPVVLLGKDSWCRYKARILEIKESISIIKQVSENLKQNTELNQTLVNPLNIKLPQGEYYSENGDVYKGNFRWQEPG